MCPRPKVPKIPDPLTPQPPPPPPKAGPEAPVINESGAGSPFFVRKGRQKIVIPLAKTGGTGINIPT